MENQGLVHQVAHGFRGRGVEIEDLVQFGNLGLIRAAEKFEPGRGLRFSTYAVYWIRQTIYRGVSNTSRPIRVPYQARRDAAAVLRHARAIEAETGDRPGLAEALDALVARGEFRAKRRGLLLRAAEADETKFRSLEDFDAEDDATASGDRDADGLEQLRAALGRLPGDRRLVLTLRHGLDGSPSLTWPDVAARMGRGEPAARRLERAALAELRVLLLDDGWPSPPPVAPVAEAR